MDLSPESPLAMPAQAPIFSSPFNPHSVPSFLPEGQMDISEVAEEPRTPACKNTGSPIRTRGARRREQPEEERTIELTPSRPMEISPPSPERALPPRPRGRPPGSRKRKEAPTQIFSPFKRSLRERGLPPRIDEPSTLPLTAEGRSRGNTRSPRTRLQALGAKIWPSQK